jgi:hypothetical protein
MTVATPGPVPHAIAVSSSTRFVSQPVLDRADDELRHAELENGRAIPGLNCIRDKLEASLTHDLLREGEAVKATDDRAARLREREGRWLALQEALAAKQEAMLLGPPRTRSN